MFEHSLSVRHVVVAPAW